MMNPTGSDLSNTNLVVAVMGRAGVGKTNILNRFLDLPFTERHHVSVGSSHFRSIKAQEMHVDLELIDTPGGYCFRYVRQQAMKVANVFVLVYSVDDVLSFLRVSELQETLAGRGNGLRLVVVQNKTDLPGAEWFEQCSTLHETVVSDWGCPHLTVSAKDDSDISAIFEEAVKVFYWKTLVH